MTDDDGLLEVLSDHYDDEDVVAELADRAEALEDDDGVDFDASTKQAPGWLKVYVECPDCEVPMARTLVESENRSVDDVDVTESTLHAICPDCREVKSTLEITRKTGPFDTLE